MQDNEAKELRIKNLLEELKLTKEHAGDSGSRVAELTRNLKKAQENSTLYEQKASDLQKTLEIRTENYLKEKADIRKQLEKALAELQKADGNSSGILAENRDLRAEVGALTKKLKDSALQLEVIQETIAAKVEEVLRVEKERAFAHEKMEKMEQEVKEIRESEEVLN